MASEPKADDQEESGTVGKEISLPARQGDKRIGILEKESKERRGIASSIGFGWEIGGIGKRESVGLFG